MRTKSADELATSRKPEMIIETIAVMTEMISVQLNLEPLMLISVKIWSLEMQVALNTKSLGDVHKPQNNRVLAT